MENNNQVSRNNNSRAQFAKKVRYNPSTQPVRKTNGNQPQKPKERYTTKTQRIVDEEKRKARMRKIRNKIIALGVAGLITFGSYSAYRDYTDSQNTVTLEQALENGETLESLGIDEEIRKKLYELGEKMDEELTNSELIDLAPEILNLQFHTAKSKLASAFKVQESDITLRYMSREDGISVAIEDIGVYQEENLINICCGKTISSDISNYIKEIISMQGTRDTVKYENIDRDEVIKSYKRALEETSKFAAGKVKTDGNGNITLEKTRVSQIENEHKEREGFEIED